MRITEFITEAANPAQQAAIAIAKKEEQGVAEELTMKHQRDHQTQKYADTSNSLAKRSFSQAEVPNVSKTADGHPTVKYRIDSTHKAGQTRVEPTITPTTVKRKDSDRPIPSFLQKGVAEDWQKVNHHDKTDSMSGKAVKAYRRENPGSKLKTAVTTKPSKLKKGGKAANRRKSFCARMGGMKKHNASAKTKHDPDSPINKALRRWNCESIEQLQELVMLAEQFVNKRKNESI